MRPGDESSIKFLRMSGEAAAKDGDAQRSAELWRQVNALADELYRLIPEG